MSSRRPAVDHVTEWFATLMIRSLGGEPTPQLSYRAGSIGAKPIYDGALRGIRSPQAFLYWQLHRTFIRQ
jgi:hypothetical protein